MNLTISCTESRSLDKKTDKLKFLKTSKTDTLKFKSGIRAIFQDSKDSYWLGSHKEGLCHYNGITFEYFTTEDGLLDNQIRSIQEDDNGTIWIETSKGVNSYNKGKLMS